MKLPKQARRKAARSQSSHSHRISCAKISVALAQSWCLAHVAPHARCWGRWYRSVLVSLGFVNGAGEAAAPEWRIRAEDQQKGQNRVGPEMENCAR